MRHPCHDHCCFFFFLCRCFSFLSTTGGSLQQRRKLWRKCVPTCGTSTPTSRPRCVCVCVCVCVCFVHLSKPDPDPRVPTRSLPPAPPNLSFTCGQTYTSLSQTLSKLSTAFADRIVKVCVHLWVYVFACTSPVCAVEPSTAPHRAQPNTYILSPPSADWADPAYPTHGGDAAQLCSKV